MTEPQSVHVEFGPIQPFIAEARRTRDSWAGSYILSYLMGNALIAARSKATTIVYPEVNGDPLITLLELKATHQPLPAASPSYRVGSLPDRLEAQVTDRAQALLVADAAAAAWRAAWLDLAEGVWAYLRKKGVPLRSETRQIWDRQVGTAAGGGPWTIRWTYGLYTEHQRRWQFYPFSGGEESGEMSTMARAHEALRGMSADRQAVRAFWADISTKLGTYDVGADGTERLDALSVVKRLLPYVAADTIGWRVPIGYPSTRALAARPWLWGLLEHRAHDTMARDCVDYLGSIEAPKSYEQHARMWHERVRANRTTKEADALLALLDYDAGLFFTQSDDAWGAVSAPEEDVADARRAVDALIRAGRNTAPALPLLRPQFTLLVMDGDRLSTLLALRPQSKGVLSQALGAFSRGVPELIEDQNALGQSVYAGGDDVFAFLPAETALTTAARVREWYIECLQPLAGADWQPTISAALVYAHVSTPLRVLVVRAHDLLEEVAKSDGELGRDSFAIEVWKGGGPILRTGRPWETHVRTTLSPETVVRWATEIAANADALRTERLTTSLFYRLQPLLEVIQPTALQPIGFDEQVDFLLAEHLRTRRDSTVDPLVERPLIERLVSLLQPRSNAKYSPYSEGTLEWSMARFIRFLTEEE